jgi:hypothetical protein
MQEREELVWPDVDIAGDVLEPLRAQASVALRLQKCGPAFALV